MKYICRDEYGPEETVEADSPEEAAAEYVSEGAYAGGETTWVYVHVREDDEDDPGEWIRVRVDPEVPDCVDSSGHIWVAPHELVGGLKENPGVWGHGGGVACTEVCRRCGMYRITDTWAHDERGVQGLTSVSYLPPDELSREWLRGEE